MSSPIEGTVRDRYSRGAAALEPELCCPVDYDPRYLAAIPTEVLERDYGCGDPSRHVSNCVLNLVENGDKRRLFDEIFRVLRRGGRAVISDIVADEPVPARLQADPELWSGCISGALTEGGFLAEFERAPSAPCCGPDGCC